jgi:hypothetical protein
MSVSIPTGGFYARIPASGCFLFLASNFYIRLYPASLSGVFIRRLYPASLSGVFIRSLYPASLSGVFIRSLYCGILLRHFTALPDAFSAKPSPLIDKGRQLHNTVVLDLTAY